MTALFIGRFQPLHLGHLDALKQIARDYNEIKVGIGSAQISGTAKNPFDYEKRCEMVESIKNDIKADIQIFPIPDINDDETWVEHVREIVGDFHMVFSGNVWVLELFRNADVPTDTQIFNMKISATEVRDEISKGKNFKDKLPASVYNLITSYDK